MGRPLGVSLLSIMALLIGLIEILRSLFGFIVSLTSFPVGLHVPTGVVFPLYLIMGFVWLFMYTFWKGAEIGWYIGILMAAFVIVLDYPVGSILGATVLLYLVIPKGVRYWFSKSGWEPKPVLRKKCKRTRLLSNFFLFLMSKKIDQNRENAKKWN